MAWNTNDMTMAAMAWGDSFERDWLAGGWGWQAGLGAGWTKDHQETSLLQLVLQARLRRLSRGKSCTEFRLLLLV